MTQSAILALEDGTVFEGLSVGATGISVGEVVFNTAMTGYQEILTDPSYSRQLVTLTYPHIGNTGITVQDNESNQVYAAGLIVRDVPRRASSWRNQIDLPEWLKQNGIVAISDIDTRKLTRILRNSGAQSGTLMAGVIDIAGERARLDKEIARIDKDLAVVSKKLGNPAFLEKAAADVVLKEQEKARAFGEKKTALEAALKRLAALAAEG